MAEMIFRRAPIPRMASLFWLLMLFCIGASAADEIFTSRDGFDQTWQIEGDLWQGRDGLDEALAICETGRACIAAALTLPRDAEASAQRTAIEAPLGPTESGAAADTSDSEQAAPDNPSGPSYIDSRLISAAIELPVRRADARLQLRFERWYRPGSAEHDIAVEIATWSSDAWSDWRSFAQLTRQGAEASWREVQFDLAEYSGQRVRLGFRASVQASDADSVGAPADDANLLDSDMAGADGIWILADVSIAESETLAPASAPMITAMGEMESGDATILDLEDFEGGATDWQIDNGVWQVGTPSAGPADCYSGETCAGTVLDGYYPQHTDSRLIAPPITLPTIGGEEGVYLRLWQWFAYASDNGAVELAVYDPATQVWSDWQRLAEVDGTAAVWSPLQLDVSAFAGRQVRLSFLHLGGHSVNAGWFLDDIAFERRTPSLPALEDFAGGWGDWWADSGVWQIGTPSAGPASCRGGETCAGTVLDGHYPQFTDSRLIGPPVVLPLLAASDVLLLRFWQWHAYADDDGQVQVSTWDGSGWTDWESLVTLDGAGDWHLMAADLTAYAGKRVRFGFLHRGGHSTNHGWFIDDISLSHFTATTLPIDAEASGTFDGSGDRRYFAIEAPPDGHLRAHLDILDNQGNYQVYLRYGALPTLGQYDHALAIDGADADGLLVPNAAPGTWYVLLYADSLGGGSGDYRLQVDFNLGVFITSVTPERVGTAVPATFTLNGAGFSPSSTVTLLDGAGGSAAEAVHFVSAERLEAEIDVTALSPGSYALRVQTGEHADEIPVEVFAGGEANLETDLIVPSRLGYHVPATIYVEYANNGDLAMPAPLLVLSATQNDRAGAILRIADTLSAPAFWTGAMPQGYSNAVQLLASGESAGVLQPGESRRVAVQYAGWQRPGDPRYPPITFTLGVLDAEDTTAVDWSAYKAEMRPDDIPADAWDALWEGFLAQAGNTWGDYVSLLTGNARYLSRLGLEVTDIADLLAFVFAQVDGLQMVSELATATDASLDAVGMDLELTRSFPTTLTGRHRLGPLGRGWQHNWEVALAQAADGTITVHEASGSRRLFQPDSRRTGVYFSMPGDYGTLTSSGGAFVLEEADGTRRGFSADGKVQSLEDPNGNRITAEYDGERLTRLTHSSGPTLVLSYNGNGRLETIAASDGDVTRFSYDAAGEHLLSVTSFDGTPVSYTIDYAYHDIADGPARRHALTLVRLPGNVQQLFTYDDQGRLATLSRNDGAERIALVYDGAGHVGIRADVGGQFDLYFDHRGLPIRTVDPFGHLVQLAYDADFALTRITDAAGRSHRYSYDDQGNLLQHIDALGHPTRFGYAGPFDRMTSLLDANGNQTRYNYDAVGNLAAITYADDSVESWTFDSNGNPVAWTNRRGRQIDYTFDPVTGHLVQKDLPDGTSVSYVYDARGNLTTVIDAIGTTTFEYFADDRLQRITYPGDRTLEYSYNVTGQRASMTNELGHRLDYHYDSAGRLERMSDEAGAEIVQYQYDVAGRMERKVLGNGVYTEYAYDDAWQLTSLINYKPDGSVLSQFLYDYDERGRRIAMTTLEGEWLYAYDDLGQLTGWISPDGRQVEYVYDRLGNRVQVKDDGILTDYTTNDLNQYIHVGETAYEYDADGNLVRKEEPQRVTTYAYDDENRLISASSNTGYTLYGYSGLGNRARSDYNGRAVNFVVDPLGFGNLTGEYAESTAEALGSHEYGFGLLASRKQEDGRMYFAFDGNGNAQNLLSTDGTIVEEYSYTPFGQEEAPEIGTSGYRYVGRYGVRTSGTGEIDMRARFYDADLGRFLSPDPIGISGGHNLYTYASGDPVSGLDPQGMRTPNWCPEWICGTVVAATGYLETVAGSEALNSGGLSSAELNSAHNKLKAEMGVILGPAAGSATVSGMQSKVAGTVLSKSFPSKVGQWFGKLVPKLAKFGSKWFVKNTKAAGPADPNQKLGPATYGEEHYIAAGSILPYRIDFENYEDATAPAQIVTITDPLDPRFDWSTFELTQIGFGDEHLTIPPGSQRYEAKVPMSYGGVDFEVQVEAGIRLGTGEVYANFYSVDPITGLPPAVDIGFLPPEDGTGRGQGFISYVIYAEEDLPTGTELRNIAQITFDGAETIATNQVDPHDPSQGTDPDKEAPIAIAPPYAFLTAASDTGGSVAAPGEGRFRYEWGTTIPIRAVPDDANSRFAGWGGDIQTIADPFAAETTIGLYEDFSITANFVVAEQVSVPWRLHTGFNLVALPHDPTVTNLAERLDDIGPAPVIERVQALGPATGRLAELIPGADDNPTVTLLGGEGLVVYATEPVDDTRTSLGCPSWQLRAGVNMVGSLCAPAGTTAYSLLADLGGPSAVASLSGFDPASGRFRTAAFNGDGAPAGGDFPIVNGSGYLLFMRADLPAFRAW